eukprot:CAMPEP_0118723640 /NCGR_PEP_ID=MMETSP0800-20121206/32114_1 /TAXON_ID=210618 ORGANISM="Striatella unipunctata, Strain CCMP2910" /NCGR_SAMPLE_ID=MMETSP0800 /ASSEMBLY_ACC=CAM_ASM_000638 /LENGTH=237 /DNA_ID=CAMNT_0006632085 /DNA_START=12 /DNA_END=721 /DNA_ORIENTATION=+
MEYELVPKGQHRRNIAERAIQTWKSHAIGALSGVSPNFPLGLWDELLPQLDIRHPLAPLGVEIQMLEDPGKRKSWGLKSQPGFYVGTSLEHYRYYWGWNRETNKIRGSDTVIFKHKYITNPTITPGDAIIQATKQLTSALCGNVPPPLTKSGIDHIKELTSIFDATKKAYEQRDEQNNDRVKETANSPRVPMDITPPRVVQDKDIPDIVPVYDSDSDNEEEETNKESEQASFTCPPA